MSKPEIEYDDVCGIMMSALPSTRWIEQSYLDRAMICSKRRNLLSIESVQILWFMAALNLAVI